MPDRPIGWVGTGHDDEERAVNEAVWDDWNDVAVRARLAGATTRRISLLQRVAMLGVVGSFVLLPVQGVDLPFNMAPVDLWNVISLPIVWAYLSGTRQRLRVPYFAAMWLILLGSLVSMFWARDLPTASLVILKELYIYAWFATVALFLASANARDLRVVFVAWTLAVLLHALLIIGEFLSHDLWQLLAAQLGHFGKIDVDRPPGLFDNANGAAFFQLMGFVPVVLLCASSRLALILGTVLLLSIVGTGSLGVTFGLLSGIVVATLGSLFVARRRHSVIRTLITLLTIGGLLYGSYALVVQYAPGYDELLAHYFYGRAESSASNHLGLWQFGATTLSSGRWIWGVGPGNAIDSVSGKTLHNDFVAFALESGLLGATGFLLLCVEATYKAARLFQSRRSTARPLAAAIFLLAMIAVLVDSQFHQVFHERSLWIVLATQEAILLHAMAAKDRAVRAAPRLTPT